MGWAARANVRSGNPKIEVSKAGRVIANDRQWRRHPPKLRGKAAVKAAKRRRTYGADGHRVMVAA